LQSACLVLVAQTLFLSKGYQHELGLAQPRLQAKQPPPTAANPYWSAPAAASARRGRPRNRSERRGSSNYGADFHPLQASLRLAQATEWMQATSDWHKEKERNSAKVRYAAAVRRLWRRMEKRCEASNGKRFVCVFQN
jgi:hypothetical protein